MRGLERTIVVGLVSALAGCVGGIWLAARSGMIDWNSVVAAAPPVVPPPPRPPVAPPGAKMKPPGPKAGDAVGVPPLYLASGGGMISKRATRVDLLPTPGCLWELEPVMYEPDGSWVRTQGKQSLMVTTASLSDRPGSRIIVNRIGPGPMFPPVRVVVFDFQGQRTTLENIGGGQGGGTDQIIEHTDWRGPVAESPATEPLYFGIERVVSDADQAATDAAQAQARASKLAILPPPRLGEPYRFNLAGADGKPVRSEDLLGKAVLITVTHGPYFGAHLPRRALSEHAADLAPVVVSFDATVEPTRKWLEQSKIDAPLVMVPNDPAIRSLWTAGAAISSIPTFLMLDREGILRFVSHKWFDLEDQVSDVLGERRRFPPPLRPEITDKFGPPRLPDVVPFARRSESGPGPAWIPLEQASPEDWATLTTPVPFVGYTFVPWRQPFRWTQPAPSRNGYGLSFSKRLFFLPPSQVNRHPLVLGPQVLRYHPLPTHNRSDRFLPPQLKSMESGGSGRTSARVPGGPAPGNLAQ